MYAHQPQTKMHTNTHKHEYIYSLTHYVITINIYMYMELYIFLVENSGVFDFSRFHVLQKEFHIYKRYKIILLHSVASGEGFLCF